VCPPEDEGGGDGDEARGVGGEVGGGRGRGGAAAWAFQILKRVRLGRDGWAKTAAFPLSSFIDPFIISVKTKKTTALFVRWYYCNKRHMVVAPPSLFVHSG
jgi:hypothetical protein